MDVGIFFSGDKKLTFAENYMKKGILFGLLALSLAGCGYSARGTEVVGQVKRISNYTPLICPDYKMLDLSLGVMRNGVGSMSTEDALIVIDSGQEKILKDAMESGVLVKVVYDKKRAVFCIDSQRFAVSIEVVK